MTASRFRTGLLVCLLVVPGCAKPQAAPKDVAHAPVLSLSFDEGRGLQCADATGAAAGKIGEGEFGPMWVKGVRGTALWFWGDPGECAMIPDRADLDLSTELTIAAWIWPRKLGSFQTIMWKGDRRGDIDQVNYRLHLRPDGRLEFAFKGPVDEWYQIIAGDPVAVGRWQYVAATYSGGKACLYVDGKCVAEGRMNVYTRSGAVVETRQDDRMLPNNAPLEVGRSQDPNGRVGQCFCGAIDEVSLWAAALPTPPEVQTPPDKSPLRSLLLLEKEFDAAELEATPYLTGRVECGVGPCPWMLDVEFAESKGRGLQLQGRTDPDGRFRYLLNDFGGLVEPRGAPRLRVKAYRRNIKDRMAIKDIMLVTGKPRASITVHPEKTLQRIRDFGSYADIPATFLSDPEERAAQYGPVLAELREIGITHLDFSTLPQSIEPENDDDDPFHINWDYLRKNFNSNKRIRTLVKYLRYVQSEGFSVGLRVMGYAKWQWVKQADVKPFPNSDEVAEYCVALLKMMLDEGINLTHLVPVWEPTYAPEVVAEVCAKTARLARRHGIDVPIVGPYRIVTGGQSTNMDRMPDRYIDTGKRYVEPYMRIASDVCDIVGVEDYASGCAMIEPNLKRLWREVINPLNKTGRPKELWIIEYGSPCGVGPWNHYPSRWHGPYVTYDSAFRLARCLHQQFNGGVSKFIFWKAYEAIGDGKLISSWGFIKSSIHDHERRPPYYIARMFWKHIPCGAQHIECTSEADVLANAFVRNNRFTIVLTTPRPNDVKADIRIVGVDLAPQVYLYTSADEIKYQEREISARGETISSFVLPPRSVSTVVCRAAYLGQPFDRTVWGDTSADVAYLSDLQWAAVSVTGGKELLRAKVTGKRVNVKRDESSLHEWIVISRIRYRKGLGMKAPAEVVYDLDAKYASFEAIVGIDDAASRLRGNASVVFQVFVDGKKLFDSGVMKSGSAPKKVYLPLKGAKELRLAVTDAGDDNNNDLADWADARFVAEGKGQRGR